MTEFDRKISAHPAVANPLDGTEILLVNQDGTTGKTTLADVAALVGAVAIPDGSITTAKFHAGAKAPLAGTADLATLATNATNAVNATTATTAGSATTAGAATTAAVATTVAANGVNTAALQDGAVTTPKIADDAVTVAKLSSSLRRNLLQFSNRNGTAPRAMTTSGRNLQYVAALDKVMFFETGGSKRLISINRITDHWISLAAAAGKTPGAWCYDSVHALVWCCTGLATLFSIDPVLGTNPTSGAGGRADYLLYNSVNGFVYGFDNGVTPAIVKYNGSTGAVVATVTTGGNNIATGTDWPWAFDSIHNRIYWVDLFGALYYFDCAAGTHHATLGTLFAGGSVNSAMLYGSDGLLYVVNATGSADLFKIKVWNPATDTLVATIDLAGLSSNAGGFAAVTEHNGYLLVGYQGTEAYGGSVIAVDMVTREPVGSFCEQSAVLAHVVGAPGEKRAYGATGAVFNFTGVTALDL